MQKATRCRGIKGATTCAENSESELLGSTQELLKDLLSINEVGVDDIAAVFFTCTPDLNVTFPARAARELGLIDVPLMCAHEMDVRGALPRCVRALILVNTPLAQSEVKHLYLKGARVLRPEFAA